MVMMLRCIVMTVWCVTSSLAYQTCCPQGERLHESKQFCVKQTQDTVHAPVFNKTASGHNKIKCVRYESFPTDSVVQMEDSEMVQTRKYRRPIPPEEYCVDQNYFVICDKCKESGKECINLCCPFNSRFRKPDFDFDVSTGTSFSGDGEVGIYDEVGAIPSDSNTGEYDLESLSGPVCEASGPMPNILFYKYKVVDGALKSTEALDWSEGENYYLIGSTITDEYSGEYLYKCPGEDTYFHGITTTEDMFIDYKGRLHNVIDEDQENGAKTSFDRERFCVTQDDVGVTYMVCSSPPEKPNDCEVTRKYVFNVGFCLTITGIVLSLATHFLDKVTLRKTRFGQICIIYLINLLGDFISIIVDRFSEFDSQTKYCEVMGYFQQYFFLSFFFSMSALGYNSYRMVKSMDDSGPRFGFLDPNNKSFLYFCIAYIQGIPFLITMITYIIDDVRKQKDAAGEIFDKLSYPEMGMYQGSCYFGYSNPDPDNRPNYFKTPEFIYVQSFQLLIMITNTIVFVLTVRSFTKNIVTPENKTKWEQRRENFATMAKLFFFMVFLWIFEIITSGIAADYGINESCVVRFVLDTPNAFFGLFVFYVMIASKPKVRDEVRQSLSGIFPGPKAVGATTTTSVT